ncbi:MAG: septal ring lytic transglycosylase RlpA family protein [Desulfobacteraceae bacterium]|nr:MAG: septal ring lytic transglycosylase RlpA family protein [Desulfobacteraceae bacterium]
MIQYPKRKAEKPFVRSLFRLQRNLDDWNFAHLNLFRVSGFGFRISVALALFAFSCAKEVPPPRPPHYPKPYRVFGVWYQPIPDAAGFRQQGIASWYGAPFHGRKTSNGETYDMHGMTAAHKTLPLGTCVRVRSLSNQREIEVRINDRGPFVRDRVIDLSYAAAKKIGIVGPGTGPVEVVALAVPMPEQKGGGPPRALPDDYLYSGSFNIQVGAFSNRENAERLKQQLAQAFEKVHIATFDRKGEIFHRVRVGPFSDLKKAEETEAALVKVGFSGAFAVAE